MTTISAKSVLSSARFGNPEKRIDTMLLRYPRFIHAEFMTHRMFSRNASSSRAIPVEKLIQSAIDDPAIPLHWGKNQRGMQADKEHAGWVKIYDGPVLVDEVPNVDAWLRARDQAVQMARDFSYAGYHKQIVNRLLEPFTHITVVVTSTNWSNFLHLRDHPDAEPHIQILAREVRKALDGAVVQKLRPGEWHLPFTDVVDEHGEPSRLMGGEALKNALRLSVSRCASTSYKTVDGFDMTLERAIELHDKLVGMDPLHASPCEHQAMADSQTRGARWINRHMSGNLGPGWVQYRKTLQGECR